ncbi:SH2 domain-containing protein 4A-like isoform X2 [Daktulosphaira vitifoliae]|uniref:SH2 domain-containing protein 4A-like isoform X2 n=1 Tax=Daktulosphaira vitifoliae TaxID=58002 RepID=UPI0021AA9217|nr:SH2 domain-containing protein 4A-like isoform X2 [Daktulosphaira vitifoliae]
MLQQILKDMYVDPELLAELDEAQRQTLFCRMREEQVRRWKLWDKNEGSRTTSLKKQSSKKKVHWMLDINGEPWTWVMGEHKNDKTIEQIIEEEAREAARIQAEQETEQLRLKVELELMAMLENKTKAQYSTQEVVHHDIEEIYCSVEDLKTCTARNSCVTAQPIRGALKELSFNKVSERVRNWEQRVMEERTSEIYKKMKNKKEEEERKAEEADKKQEIVWREQEQRAKEAELQKRQIARQAREEHRRSLLCTENQFNVLVPNSSKPPSKKAVIEWFRAKEIPRRAGFEQNKNAIATWFHGLITRKEAEVLLHKEPVGSFLVRLSEKIWGYAITYRDYDCCKHYLVDASNDHYQFLGTNQIPHNTLSELVSYHRKKPITKTGDELLLTPCNRSSKLPPLVFQGLLKT